MKRAATCATAMLLAGSAACGLWLHLDALSRREVQLKKLRAEQETLTRQLDMCRRLESDPALRRSAQALPTSVTGELLQATTRQLLAMGLSDHALKTGAASQSGEIRRVPVTLTFKGPAAGAFEIVDRLYRGSQPVHIGWLELSRDPRDMTGMVSVTVDFEAYEASVRGRL